MKAELCIWLDKALYIGPNFDNEVHSHFLSQIAIGIGRPIQIQVEGIAIESDLIFIPGGLTHRISSEPNFVLLAYFDPGSPHSGIFQKQPIQLRLEEDLMQELKHFSRLFATEENIDIDRLKSIVFEKISKPNITTIKKTKDSRIDIVLKEIQNWDFESELKLSILAEKVAISEGRLTHLFSKIVGISIKKYVQWTKLTRTIRSVRNGISLTEAAHSSGFYDSSHFSKIFYENFGVQPSKFLLNSRSIQVRIVDSL